MDPARGTRGNRNEEVIPLITPAQPGNCPRAGKPDQKQGENQPATLKSQIVADERDSRQKG